MRTRLAIEEVGELSASLAAFHSASVTLLRQSTQVPNTSKKRQRGCGVRAMLRLERYQKGAAGINGIDEKWALLDGDDLAYGNEHTPLYYLFW